MENGYNRNVIIKKERSDKMKKVKNSFGGVIFGIILFIAGIILLWWNEGNNVKNIKTVDELRKNYIDIENTPIESKNEGKLVAINGKMDIGREPLVDSEFNIEVYTAKLKRVVEMYQWEEESHEEDDRTTYSYKKVWSDKNIDSASFHKNNHNNPDMPYESQDYEVSSISLGDFNLTSNQIADLPATDYLEIEGSKEYKSGYIIKDGKYLTNSLDYEHPEIGDIRVYYQYANYDDISVLAVQKGSSFEDYVSKVGKHTNYILKGRHEGKEIINDIEEGNNTLKWILRLIGTLLVIFGIALILGPISTLTGFVPILGGVVGFVLFLVELLLGLAISLVVIAISWIFYRPVLGIILIIAAVGLIIAITSLLKKNKKEKQEA